MLLIREINDKVILLNNLNFSDKEKVDFIKNNSTGGFKLVESLPFSQYNNWKLDGTGNIIADDEENNKAEQRNVNIISKEYLSSTDWYVTRQAETGKAIPEDILNKRQEAREAINESI